MSDIYQLFSTSYIIGIIGTVIATVACPIIADRKGRSVGGWIIGGLLLGWLGLIIVACLTNLNQSDNTESYYFEKSSSTSWETNTFNQSSHSWRCPKCNQMVNHYPCSYCGYSDNNTDI